MPEGKKAFQKHFPTPFEGEGLHTSCLVPPSHFPRGPSTLPGVQHHGDESVFSTARRNMTHIPHQDTVTCGIQSKHSQWDFSTVNNLLLAVHPMKCHSLRFFLHFVLCHCLSSFFLKKDSYKQSLSLTLPLRLSLEESVEVWTPSSSASITCPSACWMMLLGISRKKLSPHLLQETALILAISIILVAPSPL